jgi:hypothetical protein
MKDLSNQIEACSQSPEAKEYKVNIKKKISEMKSFVATKIQNMNVQAPNQWKVLL